MRPTPNGYLGYLADRNYPPQTARAYGFDLLAFCRWLADERISLADVSTEVVLDFLRACREAGLPGRPQGNVVSITGQRLDRYAAQRPAGASGGGPEQSGGVSARTAPWLRSRPGGPCARCAHSRQAAA
jgi:Phage integrase, N-terminal SAM-like domain